MAGAAACVLALVSPALHAQELPPELRALHDVPESKVPRVSQPGWGNVTGFTDTGIEEETARLKRERGARVRAVTEYAARHSEIQARLRGKAPAARRKDLAYEAALLRFRMADENRLVKIINERLDVLAQERVRRRPELAQVPAAEDLASPENAKKAGEVLSRLLEYDTAVVDILRREPLTEADVVLALALFKEKTSLGEALTDYLRDLADQAAAEAASAPSAPDDPAPAP